MSAMPKSTLQPPISTRMRSLGRQAIGASLFGLVMTCISLVQMGPTPRGEIGNFAVQASFYIVPCCFWGLATGIGILRAWRWARISMLIFGAMLALFCSLPALLFLAMPVGSVGWWEVLGLKLIGLFFLIPPAFVVRRHLFFMSDEAKAYFRPHPQLTTPAV